MRAQVWQFEVADASFRTSAGGAAALGPEVYCDKVKIVAVRPNNTDPTPDPHP